MLTRNYDPDAIEYRPWPNTGVFDPAMGGVRDIPSPNPAQLDLFGPEEVFYPEGATLAERFEIFHQANPGVFRALVRLAMERRRAGITRGRIKALFEILRDRHELETRGDDWKLNNSYTAFYARLMMDTVPELRGWFETRRQTAVEEAA